MFRIGPEQQSQFTKNINIRKHAISQLLQDDREMQFPRYYQSKGHFKNQELINQKRLNSKYKMGEPGYVDAETKRDTYFSTKALSNLIKEPGEIKRHDFFQNQQKLVQELQKNHERVVKLNKANSENRYLKKMRLQAKPTIAQQPKPEDMMEVMLTDFNALQEQPISTMQ